MAFPVPASIRANSLNDTALVTVSPSSPSLADRQRGHLRVAPVELPSQGLQLKRQPCPSCGGSGMLRINVQSHRTCLDCLGGGQRLLTSADVLRCVGFRAAGSSSAEG